MKNKNGQKILLVDDNVKNLQLAMNILKDFNVIYAQDGQKALELVDKNSFDLILLDIVMPNLDGYSICRKLKEKENTKDIPIIFLTVKDEEKDIVKGFDLGAVDYVTKPFCPEILLKRVEVHLKLSKTLNELHFVNNNLNDIIQRQIDKLRQNDELLTKQSNIIAMSDIIDIILMQWKLPFSKLNLYMQSLNYNFSSISEKSIEDSIKDCMEQMEQLNNIMQDFHKFFNNKHKKEYINIKVSLDNSIIKLKNKLANYNINISGSNLLQLNIVENELSHIFTKILESIIQNIYETTHNNIDISIENKDDYIFIKIVCSGLENINNIRDMFGFSLNIHNKYFDLGYYLVKIFVEKNKGIFEINQDEDNIIYEIKFFKDEYEI